jgi:anti-sigma factor RsiW
VEHVREEQLALYARGDLPSWESKAVTTHLQGCSQCQKALTEFYEIQNFVTRSLQDPGTSELSKVRIALAASLRPQQDGGRHWAWWGAGVAAALALFVLPRSFEHQPIVMERAKPITAASALPQSIIPGPAIQIPLAPVAASRPRHVRSQKAGIRAVTLITQADQEPVIKMTTADPNVVILWQLNQRTEQEP